MIIKGRLVNLRKIRLDDIGYIARWQQDEELMKYYDESVFKTIDEISKGILNNLKSPERIDYMIETIGKKPIGTIALKRIDWISKNCEILIMVGEERKK